MEPTEIIRRLDASAADRRRFEPIYDEALRLTMPGRKRFFGATSAPETGEDIFDETGANAVAEFVSRISAGVIPPFSKFLRLEASSLVDPRDRRAVNADLDEITDFAFEEIWASNFAQEASESMFDMALSTGTLLVEEGQHGRALHHKAIPLTEVFLEAGHDGSVGGVFRQHRMKASHVQDRYPRAQISDSAARSLAGMRESDVTVVEYNRVVPGRVPRFEHVVLVKEIKEIIDTRALTGEGSSPFLIYRWSTTAGEVMGRGPLLNALAAIRTTNLMVELVLENAAMSIVGMYQTDNDATVNAETVRLLPGTIITKEIGTKGLEPISGPAGNFNMRDVVLNDQRVNIKRALYNDMLSDPNKTPATAYEVSERMADLAYRSATGYARLTYELVQPYFRRVLRILEKRGDIKLPVKNGRAISFRAVSPLALAQGGREVQSLVQGHQITAAIFGPQTAAAQYQIEELLPWLQQRQGLDERLFKDAKEVIKSITNAAEQMAAMQQAPALAPGAAPV